jgi:hypothetical protein
MLTLRLAVAWVLLGLRPRLRTNMKSLKALVALLCLATTCASASAASPGEPGPECGKGVQGPGFRVFACMSGGAQAGHPHPKELLVVRDDGSSVAYPAYGGFGFAVGDAQVVAVHDYSLLRVTSRRLISLVTRKELASALHVRTKAFLIMGFDKLRIDKRGDIDFYVSTLIPGHYGCQSRHFERLTSGKLHELWSSSTPPNNVCY